MQFLFTTCKINFISSRTNCTYDLAHGLPNDLRLRILQSKEMSEKLKKFIGTQTFAQSTLQKYIFGTSAQTVRKNRYHFFFVLSNFAWFLYFSQNILYWVVLFQKENFCKWYNMKKLSQDGTHQNQVRTHQNQAGKPRNQ